MILPPNLSAVESYYLNNNWVLLYKIINWWNMSRPKESARLCGQPVKCENNGNIRSRYNPSHQRLTLDIPSGFANLLSALKPCTHCFGPTYLKNAWLNPDYFLKAEAENIKDEFPAIATLKFNRVASKQATKIRKIENKITLILEGKVGGLLEKSGKIALHPTGKFFRKCPGNTDNAKEEFPITLRVIRSDTKEVLATYTALWK